MYYYSIVVLFRIISPAAGPDATTFQPGSDKALLNHYTTINSFRGSLYPINSAIPAGRAVNIGRYKEDSYYNGLFRLVVLLNNKYSSWSTGNPWYLAT